MTDDIIKTLNFLVDQSFVVAGVNIPKDCNSAAIPHSALCVNESGEQKVVKPLPWNSEESKVTMLLQLGKECFEDNLLKVALFTDAAMKQYDTKPDETTDLPLDCPPDMRVDCLILTYIDFMDAKENFFKAYPYSVKDGILVRKEEISFGNNILAMDSLIMSCISLGFLKAAIADEYLRKEIIATQFNKEVGDVLLRAVLEKYPGAALGSHPDINKKDEDK